MPDREKVINALKELSGFLFKEYRKAQAEEASLYYDGFLTVDNAIELLKEEDNEEKRIMKVIWDTLHEGLSIDTVPDKDWVYEVIRHRIEDR